MLCKPGQRGDRYATGWASFSAVQSVFNKFKVFSLLLISLSLSLFALQELRASRCVSFIVSLRSTARLLLPLPPLSLKVYQVSFQRSLPFPAPCIQLSETRSCTYTLTAQRSLTERLDWGICEAMDASLWLSQRTLSWYSCNILTVSSRLLMCDFLFCARSLSATQTL